MIWKGCRRGFGDIPTPPEEGPYFHMANKDFDPLPQGYFKKISGRREGSAGPLAHVDSSRLTPEDDLGSWCGIPEGAIVYEDHNGKWDEVRVWEVLGYAIS